MANPSSSEYYAVLGVGRGATGKEIKKAYRRAAVRWHPDKCREAGAEENFKRISEAYQVLSNEELRRSYDANGKGGSARVHAAHTYDRRATVPGGEGGRGGAPFGGGFGFGDTSQFGGGGGLRGMAASMFAGFRNANDVFREAFAGEDPFAHFISYCLLTI